MEQLQHGNSKSQGAMMVHHKNAVVGACAQHPNSSRKNIIVLQTMNRKRCTTKMPMSVQPKISRTKNHRYRMLHKGISCFKHCYGVRHCFNTVSDYSPKAPT